MASLCNGAVIDGHRLALLHHFRGRDRLLARIREIHERFDETYGAPRIHEELKEEGICVGKKRVARLLRLAGLQGVSRRRRFKTTQKGSGRSTARGPRRAQLLRPRPRPVMGLGYHLFVPTRAGFLFLAVVLDACSRKIVGWSMANHLRTELVLDALDMAIHQRKPAGVICHSDQGSQYTSVAFGKRCREADVRPSTGSRGEAYYYAMCERFLRRSSANSSTDVGSGPTPRLR